ncbi:hypothetical protein, partial [Micromonospora sp. KC721]|uniref:hypothetical protein n=1 Tax=Micromonospora sp. KC721 TaxID=2530380 RepID=UPI0010D7EA56
MPQTFIVDQAATFQAVAFLGAEPRIEFGTRDKQETTKDGLPRWDVQVVAGFRDNFGKVQNEVIKVGYAGAKNPAESIGMYTPVHHNDACRKRALRASQRSTDPVAGRAGPGVPRAGGTQERAAGGPGLAAGPGAGLPGSGHPDPTRTWYY